jgi:hypothetical protein
VNGSEGIKAKFLLRGKENSWLSLFASVELLLCKRLAPQLSVICYPLRGESAPRYGKRLTKAISQFRWL